MHYISGKQNYFVTDRIQKGLEPNAVRQLLLSKNGTDVTEKKQQCHCLLQVETDFLTQAKTYAQTRKAINSLLRYKSHLKL